MENRTVKEASVEGVQRRTQPKKHFMFCVKVSWSDGTVNLIYRRYSEFLHLQAILFQAFPGSLCRPGTKRKAITPLPDSFATRMNVGETVFTRMEQVNYFLKEVLSLAYNVSQSQHIRRFLTPTQEDLEPRPPPKRVRFKKKTGRRRSSNFTQTVRRLQKFGKTRVFGNKISSPIVLEHFVVMDDYKKQAKSDISLKKGKSVDVIEKRECGWWLVESEGEVGWAPALYLEPADEMADVSNVQTFSVGRGEIYVTSKRYVAVEDDELSFEIGVNLQILEKNYDGWWKASYLGREGWVPAMYLKKLGNERARTWRRKSRLFSSNELRDEIDEEDEVFQELPEEEKPETKSDKKASLPRKISHQVMSAIGKKSSKDGEKLRQNSKGADEDESAEDAKSQGEHKSIDTMVEMSTVFLQLHKKDSNPITGTPEKSQTLPVQRSPRLPQKSPKPTLQRKAVSSVAAPTFGLQSSDEQHQEGSKDDLSLGNSRSRSLDSMPTFNLTQNTKNGNSLESNWKPEVKNALSSSLKCVTESPESDQDATKNGKPDLSPQSAGKLNDLSLPDLNSVSEDEEDSAGLQNETNSSNDINSLDRRSDSTSSTELAQSPNVVMEEPVDLSRHFKTISLGGDSPRFDSPKRTPPVPTLKSLNALEDLRPRSPAPKRLPPVPGGISTFPRRANVEFEPHEDRRNPQSIDRKIIRQSSFERETAVELNEEIQCWSSSDESEPELAQLSFNQVVLHPESGHSPAIVVDEAEKTEENGEKDEEEEEEEEEETGKEFNGEGPFEEEELDTYLNEDDDARLNDDRNFTESLKVQLKVPPKEDDDESTDIYCAFEDCEIDNEMYLSKGDYVKVLERASTGWWLVKNEEGLKGWAPSNFLCPAPQVKGNTECLVSTEEGKCSFEQQCDPQMSCRIIANYKGDPYNQELDLRKGEFAHVLHKSESGWWCLLDENGETGWAPSNYLEVFEDEDDHEYIIQSGK